MEFFRLHLKNIDNRIKVERCVFLCQCVQIIKSSCGYTTIRSSRYLPLSLIGRPFHPSMYDQSITKISDFPFSI